VSVVLCIEFFGLRIGDWVLEGAERYRKAVLSGCCWLRRRVGSVSRFGILRGVFLGVFSGASRLVLRWGQCLCVRVLCCWFVGCVFVLVCVLLMGLLGIYSIGHEGPWGGVGSVAACD